jgi:hypothetical protein
MFLPLAHLPQETLNQSEEGGLPVSRNSLDSLYDVFEPTLIAGTLKRHPEFGPLIFGQEWLSLGGVVQMHDDALTAFYHQNGRHHLQIGQSELFSDILQICSVFQPNSIRTSIPLFSSQPQSSTGHTETPSPSTGTRRCGPLLAIFLPPCCGKTGMSLSLFASLPEI